MFIVPVSRRAFPVSRGLDRLFDDAFDRFFTAPVAIANDAPPATTSRDSRVSCSARRAFFTSTSTTVSYTHLTLPTTPYV